MTRPARAALAGALALLVLGAPPTATASPRPTPSSYDARAGATPGTLVFIRDHDVWIARADGTGARAVTRDGTAAFPYGSPTQSDAGVVVATHVDELVRMTQQGRVLNRIDPGPLPSSLGGTIDSAPLSAAISPDGRRIVYTLYRFFTQPDAGFRYATAYTAADRLSAPGPLGTTYRWAPSWVGNNRTLQHGGFGSHVNLHDVGGAEQEWFSWSLDLGDTTLSRDGRWLAGILGFGADAQVAVFEVSGDARTGPAPAAPTGRCSVDPQEGTESPTFGPGHQLWWEQGGSIWTHPDVGDCLGATERRLVTNAAEPHWSPAPLSAVTPPPAPVVRNTGRPAVTGKARVGRVLRATMGRWAPRPTSYAVRWFRNGRPIAGAGRATYRVTRADRGRRLTVRVTARRAGHVSGTATSRPVQVRR